MTQPGSDARPAKGTLVGISEASDLFGVQRTTVDQWRQRGVMPAPDYDLEGGPVWWEETLRRWAKATGRA